MRKPAFESKRDILSTLSANAFVSGTELADQFAISRAAIARHVSELQALGVDIFAVKGKGYRLAQTLDLIDPELLKQRLTPRISADAELHVLPLVDSTNQFWLNKKDQNVASGSACWAECQSAGRGRRGRSWQSPFGAALYCSVWWQSQCNLSELMGLSVAVGLAMTRWLQQMGVPAQVKWPNDIYIDNKKVAGILVELESRSDGCGSAVVGVGLNVNLPKQASDQIDQPWTDLSQWLKPVPPRTNLAAGLYQAIVDCLEAFERGGLQHCLTDWSRYDVYHDQAVCLVMGAHQIQGVCRGVDGQGALLVETQDGLRSFFGGELSLRQANVAD
ncbi:bifunctional biotin--[acetyl-CoA-carboxylase] ligase/biotin operon repressor BirA [Neiella marina]|uniref:Bifunctional ligase/repressor BirA n=1 Tax=Neiella holothuriorum TaxID=2870530 RepID=A0ABS7EH36_9GAMM|nr:bifunctional biotin--[acetyl-CoA-carboxylase] ligase/biotin operon repressor BirA [Neiella holothuriorum]MBW8191658.1 bifunctional biotin--[acetyl-CoA-carboxylase] ligase/biotin operon repressor BirA [Neiella holothuriorum]